MSDQEEEYFITMIRNSNSYAESLGHLKEYKRQVSLLQRTLSIQTVVDNLPEYNSTLINKLLKSRIDL